MNYVGIVRPTHHGAQQVAILRSLLRENAIAPEAAQNPKAFTARNENSESIERMSDIYSVMTVTDNVHRCEGNVSYNPGDIRKETGNCFGSDVAGRRQNDSVTYKT